MLITWSITVFSVLLMFVVLNVIIYSHPLGIHSFQILEKFHTGGNEYNYLRILKESVMDIAVFSPIVFLVPVFVFFFDRDNETRRPIPARLLLILSLLFVILVPIILPNAGGRRWGPRYHLILMPFLVILVLHSLETIKQIRPKWVFRSFLLVFIMLSGLGIYQNTIQGPRSLAQNYENRIFPALQKLSNHPIRTIVISHQFAAQELEALIGAKNFFRIKTGEELGSLCAALIEKDENHFIYITFANQTVPELLTFGSDNLKFQIHFKAMGTYGIFNLYESELIVTSLEWVALDTQCQGSDLKIHPADC